VVPNGAWRRFVGQRTFVRVVPVPEKAVHDYFAVFVHRTLRSIFRSGWLAKLRKQGFGSAFSETA